MKAIAAIAGLLLATPGMTAAWAAPDCTVAALNALRVPGVGVTQAATVPATGSTPRHCAITGTMQTAGDGAPTGSARFVLQLPDAWQQRFFMMGVGGNAGVLTPSVNPLDQASALGRGYALIVQDSGHIGRDEDDASWVRDAAGRPDTGKIADYMYRAAHDVAVTGKYFVRAYYAAPVKHAYFDGCAAAGRTAMMEAERYPTDFDGIIAGAPEMDGRSTLLRVMQQKAALSHMDGYLSPDTLAMIDRAVTARCDAIDGAKDGLVQDPARCPVKPQDLLCRPNGGADCLTPPQVTVLKAYTVGLHDQHRHLLYPGLAITDLSGPHGASPWIAGNQAPDASRPASPWGKANAPLGWTLARQALTFWLGMGDAQSMLAQDVDPDTGRVGDKLLDQVDQTFGPGETKNVLRLMTFIQQDRKMILYHGTSDPALPAARTVRFFDDLAAALHKSAKPQANVRLFLVPGMQACGGGPDQFDTLSAIEAWAEQGKPPDAIAASTPPGAETPHALPLCPYPRMARYSNNGEVTDAANWACGDNQPGRVIAPKTMLLSRANP